MKNVKDIIKEEIARVLKELSVDEPEGGPFGKVLFSQERTDKVDKTEPNTALEQEFLTAYDLHQSGGSDRMARVFDKVLKVAKTGKYKNLIQPPDGIYVYRLSTNMNLKKAMAYLGLSKEEILSYADGKAYYLPLQNKPYKSRAKIQSWTAYPVRGTFDNLDLSTGDVAILFEANTSNNNFLVNPKLPQIVDMLGYENEYETIAKGPVNLSGAAFAVGTHLAPVDKSKESEFKALVEKFKTNLLASKEFEKFIKNNRNLWRSALKNKFFKHFPNIQKLEKIAEKNRLDFYWHLNPTFSDFTYNIEQNEDETNMNDIRLVIDQLLAAANTKKYVKKKTVT